MVSRCVSLGCSLVAPRLGARGGGGACIPGCASDDDYLLADELVTTGWSGDIRHGCIRSPDGRSPGIRSNMPSRTVQDQQLCSLGTLFLPNQVWQKRSSIAVHPIHQGSKRVLYSPSRRASHVLGLRGDPSRCTRASSEPSRHGFADMAGGSGRLLWKSVAVEVLADARLSKPRRTR